MWTGQMWPEVSWTNANQASLLHSDTKDIIITKKEVLLRQYKSPKSLAQNFFIS